MKTKNHLIQKMLYAGAVTILCIAISPSLFSQEDLHNITGKIVAAKNGEPLNGASVMVAGTTKGTVSNEKGIFSITAVSREDSLIISFTGYATQHVAIAGQTNITITLTEGETSLEDVVVVGYGRQAKQNVVGAVSVTKGEDIVKSNASSLSNSLAGRVSGVIAVQRSAEPGDDDAELFIRGMATLNDNSPLIMVDGIQRDFSQIDPNEIASISILKDASATAIYGTRGANGVILVTTKRGVTSKPVFNYTGYVGWQNVINVPDYLNSYDFARLYNQAALNDNPDLEPDELPYSDEDIQKYKDHSDPYTHPDIKWYESIIEPNALQTRHSVSMTGGSDKFRYFMLLGYLDQQGIYRSDNLTRYNGRINIDADVTKTTTISATVAGDFGHRSRPGTGNAKDDGGIFSLVVYLPPNAFPVKNEDGTWASLWGANPVADVTISGSRDNYPTNMQTAVNVNQRLDFITSGLSLKVVAASDFGYDNYKDFYTPYLSYYNGQEFGGDFKPSLWEGYSKYRNNTFETHLNYARTFNRHEVTALALYTQSAYTSSNIDASRTDYSTAVIPQLFAGPRTNIDNDGSASEGGREGLLGRLTYNYDKKYFFEASFGYNGSQNFPPGNRFGFFPAAAAGWNMKGENFMKNLDIISTLKLRGSYGEVGNDNVGYRSFLYKSPVYFGSNYVFGGSSPVPVQTIYAGELANPNVTWERARKTNIGIDAGIKNDMLTVTADVFFENRNNILTVRNQAVPGTFGALLPVENIASVSNHGFDATLNYRNKIGAFSYYATLTYTFARNKIKFIDEAANIPSYQQSTGKPIGQFFGYVVEGLYQTQKQIDELPRIEGVEPKLGQFIYKDVNGDGTIDSYDITAIGKSPTPENIYGLTLGAEYKGFDIYMLWQGASGYDVMRAGESFAEFNYGATALSYIKDNWTPENTDASYPRLSLFDYNYKQEESTFWLHSAAYLRLKNLEIGYTLSNKLFNTKFFTKFRVYVTSTNLITFSKEKDFDPESASGYPYYYPVTRLTSVGINLSF